MRQRLASVMFYLFGGLTLAFFLSLLALETFVIPKQLGRTEAAVRAQDLVEAVGFALRKELMHESRILMTISKVYRVSETDSADQLNTLIARLASTSDRYVWIGITDLQGQVMAATSDWLVGDSVASRQWFNEAVRGQVFLSDVHDAHLLAQLIGHPMRLLDIALPLYDQHDVQIAVLGAHLDARWVNDALEILSDDRADAETVQMRITDRNGVALFQHGGEAAQTPVFQTDTGFNLLPLSASRRMPLGDLSNPADEIVSHIDWMLEVTVPLRSNDVYFSNFLSFALSFYLMAASLLVLTLFYISRYLVHPIKALTADAERLTKGDVQDLFAPNSHITEINALASSLQLMARDMSEIRNHLEDQVNLRTAQLTSLNSSLNQLAHSDALTGIPNRLASVLAVERAYSEYRMSGRSFCVILCDVDHFKQINDTYGHKAGDIALKFVARILSTQLRRDDFVGRYGGEEFLFVLAETDMASARGVAEKLRQAIAAEPWSDDHFLTMSFGIAEVQGEDALAEDAILRADQQLYRAKTQGRNRVVG